jgi:ribosomal protein S18 acetylase RimI-like enzyme
MTFDETKHDTGKAISACSPDTAVEPAHEPVTLRRATSADAALLALVGAATFLEAFTWMLPGADILAHCTANHTPEGYAAYLSKTDTRITLAIVAGGAPVGYAMLTAPELPSFAVRPTDIELKRIYLFSRFRGAAAPVVGRPDVRVAQALLDAAIADAEALGRERLLLGTHGGNTRAIRFYQRNGFVEAGTRTFQVGSQACCDLIFARSLPSSH